MSLSHSQHGISVSDSIQAATDSQHKEVRRGSVGEFGKVTDHILAKLQRLDATWYRPTRTELQ